MVSSNLNINLSVVILTYALYDDFWKEEFQILFWDYLLF